MPPLTNRSRGLELLPSTKPKCPNCSGTGHFHMVVDGIDYGKEDCQACDGTGEGNSKPKPIPRTKVFIGIDPGTSGGIAMLAQDGSAVVWKMPETTQDLWTLLKCRGPSPIAEVFAVVEKVHAMPGNGVTSMFTFGVGYGKLLMALTAAGIPFEEVTPQKWAKGLSIPPRKSKDGESRADYKRRLRTKAQQLYPKEKITLATADALLIATYCMRWREGIL